MAGKIVADTLEHSTAGSVTTNYVIHGSSKAWVNFDMTGTAEIVKSFNISGLVDNGTATVTNSFVSSFSDADYCQTVGGDSDKSVSQNGLYLPTSVTLITTGSLRTETVSYNGSFQDSEYNTWSLMGDLA